MNILKNKLDIAGIYRNNFHLAHILETDKVVCCPPEGQEVLYSHPRVYAVIAEGKTWACPYCGQEFKD